MSEHVEIETLIHDHAAEVWRYLRFLGCDDATAEDLRQETFVSVLRSPFDYRGRKAAGAYLRMVARNMYINALRRERRQVPLEDLDVADDVWETTRPEGDEEEWFDALRQCLETLDERSRRSLEMRYRDGQSGEAIASELDSNLGAIKSVMQRAKATLRACVERKVVR